MTRGAPGVAAAILGVGVDAVDVARFRRVLDRRPRFAARCFTDSERSTKPWYMDWNRMKNSEMSARNCVPRIRSAML